ncbi:hypothetical protein BRADI_2g31576v3 [Brachypodium distachyon]|uniref:Uncharacterized protein n=1 Tax=Brachypodium distachyon TaxID=15368 RepID=A0A0Q3K7W0_BRADI|nr:hypothetical protein BRADI_2g31576v3 [Brachypodium distachyon]
MASVEAPPCTSRSTAVHRSKLATHRTQHHPAALQQRQRGVEALPHTSRSATTHRSPHRLEGGSRRCFATSALIFRLAGRSTGGRRPWLVAALSGLPCSTSRSITSPAGGGVSLQLYASPVAAPPPPLQHRSPAAMARSSAGRLALQHRRRRPEAMAAGSGAATAERRKQRRR